MHKCPLPHINCDCAEDKKIPEDRLKFVKNQRVRIGTRQITATFEGTKQQKDKKSVTAKQCQQKLNCDLNRDLIIEERSEESAELVKTDRKKRTIVRKRKKKKLKVIKPKKKIKNLIYMQQFKKDICVQQPTIEHSCDTKEQNVEVFIKEEPDPYDLVDSKIDILDFDISDNLNPKCQQQSRRKQILQVKAVPEDCENVQLSFQV